MLRRGFSVQAPLLPGHGENWHAMTEVRLQDWIEAVRLTYLSMRNDERPVAIIGFCLGGALALRLAGELYPRAICTLATPVRPLPEATFPLSGGICSVEKNINDSSSVEVRRWRQRGCHPVVPEPFFAQYQQLLEELLLALPSVKSPLLVAQSRNDAITTPEDAERIVACVQSERRKLVWSRRAGHALPIDTGRRALFSEIVSFLENEEQAILSSY